MLLPLPPPLLQMKEWVENGETKNGVRFNFYPGQVKAWQSKARIVALVSGTESGKGLPLDTLIPTPLGLCPSELCKRKRQARNLDVMVRIMKARGRCAVAHGVSAVPGLDLAIVCR